MCRKEQSEDNSWVSQQVRTEGMDLYWSSRSKRVRKKIMRLHGYEQRPIDEIY